MDINVDAPCKCPECRKVMHFVEAWLEAPDLIVSLLECSDCKYSAVLHLRPSDQTFVAIEKEEPF